LWRRHEPSVPGCAAQERGSDLYRSKGILAIKGTDDK
jgi:hypothetical protein